MSRKRVWKDEFKKMLGNVRDVDIARLAGIPEYVVQRWRRFYNIKSFRHLNKSVDRIKAISDEELMHKPLEEFRPGERVFIAKECRRRGLRRHKARRIVYRIGRENLKSVMVKAALNMNPPPTLQEVGEVLGLTRERVRQIANRGRWQKK